MGVGKGRKDGQVEEGRCRGFLGTVRYLLTLGIETAQVKSGGLGKHGVRYKVRYLLERFSQRVSSKLLLLLTYLGTYS